MSKPDSEFINAFRLDQSPGELGADPLDSSSPFPDLWKYQTTSSGSAAKLVKTIEATALQENVLGTELVNELNKRADNASKASADALDKRIAEISEQAVTNLMGKATRVAISAATRQQAIEKIINRCRRALVTKGFPADSERWSLLQQSCERFVNESLMIA